MHELVPSTGQSLWSSRSTCPAKLDASAGTLSSRRLTRHCTCCCHPRPCTDDDNDYGDADDDDDSGDDDKYAAADDDASALLFSE